MAAYPDKLTNARAVLLRVVRGELTPKSHPTAFEDDMVMFAVAIVEQADPEWLLAQLVGPDATREGVHEVVQCLTHLRVEAEARLARVGDEPQS